MVSIGMTYYQIVEIADTQSSNGWQQNVRPGVKCLAEFWASVINQAISRLAYQYRQPLPHIKHPHFQNKSFTVQRDYQRNRNKQRS